MAGCFGNHPEDKAREGELMRYLNDRYGDEGDADNPDVTSDDEPELPDSEESEYPFEDDEDLSEFIGG